jgi:hypothetical protein
MQEPFNARSNLTIGFRINSQEEIGKRKRVPHSLSVRQFFS